jgi:multiple sugar transport system substrate-binding protein
MKKISFAVFALMMTASMVFAQGVTLRWAYWGGEARIKRSQQAIDLFTAANPTIKVNPEVSGGSGDHFPKVDTQLAGGAGPDIIQMGGNIGDYVKKGVLLPLDAYAGKVLDVNSIDPSAIQSGTLEGKLYGVSTGVTMPALVYNKSLLQRAGAPLPAAVMTYDQFRNYLLALKAKLPAGTYPMQDIGAMSSNSTPFGYWAGYNGTRLFIANPKSTALKAADIQKYFELFADYRKNGLIPPADVAAGFAETNADTSAIIAGKVAIGFLWTNQLSGYQAATKDELALIEFPGAAVNKSLWQSPSQFYTVNKDSKNPEAAVKFINFLVNSPEAAKVLGLDRGASASATARTAALEGVDQKVLDYLKAAGPHTSAATPNLPNDTEFNSTFFLLYQHVAFGSYTPAKGAQQAYDLIVRLIGK